jgi:hypothetical protein
MSLYLRKHKLGVTHKLIEARTGKAYSVLITQKIISVSVPVSGLQKEKGSYIKS